MVELQPFNENSMQEKDFTHHPASNLFEMFRRVELLLVELFCESIGEQGSTMLREPL